MNRRNFLTSSLAASALASVSTSTAQSNSPQEYYELRIYRLKPETNHTLLDGYLQNAAIPAWNRLGCRPVGVFTDTDPKSDPAVYVLIPFSTLEVFATVTNKLKADAEYLKAGEEYLQSPKDKPAFARIDSWLMLAFAGLPKIELPSYSKEKKPRIFELRTYESHSEAKALKKIDMFNNGEIDLMRQVDLGPIFFGQALIGPSLPHLTYMLSAETRELHKQHFDAFGKHATWKKLSTDPQYADTVSKISSHFLAPTAYSQI